MTKTNWVPTPDRGIPEHLRRWVREFRDAHPAAEVVAVKGDRLVVKLYTNRKLYEVAAEGEPKRAVFTAV
mgnify:CR=1 FL=1